jgi:hypothetical protein
MSPPDSTNGQGTENLEAYKREREGLQQRLATLRELDPETRFVVSSGLPQALGPGLKLGPTAADLVAEAEQNLADVEATIGAFEEQAK